MSRRIRDQTPHDRHPDPAAHPAPDHQPEPGGRRAGSGRAQHYGALGAVSTIVSLDAPDAPWLDLGHARAIGLGPGRGGSFSYAPRLLPWLRAVAHLRRPAQINGPDDLDAHNGEAANFLMGEKKS